MLYRNKIYCQGSPQLQLVIDEIQAMYHDARITTPRDDWKNNKFFFAQSVHGGIVLARDPDKKWWIDNGYRAVNPRKFRNTWLMDSQPKEERIWCKADSRKFIEQVRELKSLGIVSGYCGDATPTDDDNGYYIIRTSSGSLLLEYEEVTDSMHRVDSETFYNFWKSKLSSKTVAVEHVSVEDSGECSHEESPLVMPKMKSFEITL